MAKEKNNKKKNEFSLFKDLREKIQHDIVASEKIPSIEEFVENKKYLGLPHKLFDLQKLVLRCFYRGSEGNEEVKLTKEDIELITNNGLHNVEKGNMLEKWKSNNDFRELVLVWGRRCLSEDCEIIEPKTGRMWRLGDLWNFGKTNGIDAWTYDEMTKNMIVMTNCNLVYQGKRDVFRVKTTTGHEIEITDNHPMLTEKGWRQLKELRVRDKIAIASTQPFFGNSIEITSVQAALLGYMSSCSFDSTGKYVATVMKDGTVFEDFTRNLTSLRAEMLVENAETKNIKSYDDRKYNYIYSIKNTTTEGDNIIALLEENGLKNKNLYQKFVPVRLFTCPRNIVATYLRSLFSADCKLELKKTKKVSCKITITFHSQILAKQIQHLLSRFGILANITSKIQRNNPSFTLDISKNAYVKMFLQEIGLLTYQDKIEEISKSMRSTEDNDKPIFAAITHITKIGAKRTFDLQVSDHQHLQNFVSNGFICHNSGKDYICSIIALYEAMRLLEIPGGDPYKIYNLGSATPFTILTIANSSSQAKILFREIKDKVLHSEYFRDKILPEGVTADAIYFLTPEDKKQNEELQQKGFAPNPGSIVVRSGHSNSDTLVGISCYVLLLDEIGLYKNTAGSSSGDAIFNSLAPAVKTYVREVPKLNEKKEPVLDETGKPIIEKIYDGKIICLSTPRGKEGIFFDLYENHMDVDHRLVCQAATWQVNPMQSKEGLMAAFPSMPEEKFRMEFGAEFSGTAGENFFPDEAVEDCFKDKNLKLRDFGMPGAYYFAHLDPATSSHNYALLLAHRETYFDKETMKKDWRIVVDHIKYWSPSPGKPIMVDEVDDYVVQLNSRFCLGVVTYDHFNSQVSIEKLRKKGVPTKMTPYTKRYKNIIFDNLYQLVIQRKLVIPNHLLLKNEMKNIQRKWLHSGYKVYPKRDGDITTDDIVDALAGACYNCIEKEVDRLPQGKLISLPVNNDNNIVWRSMQGIPYGVGSGGKVANDLEKRASYPRRGA